MTTGPHVESDARTHCGTIRRQNEDRVVDRTDLGLWAVADGVGGIKGGEIAADLVAGALQTIRPGLDLAQRSRAVADVVQSAHAEILKAQTGALRRVAPSTTVVILLIDQQRFACLWAGDSRLYRLRQGELVQITRDHTLVQELVAFGAVRPEDAEGHPRANVVTRAVGQVDTALNIEERSGSARPGDVFLLCSDGLSKTVERAVLASLLMHGDAASHLVEAALAAGARDNVTAVVVRCR